jgi:hypothetical protein
LCIGSLCCFVSDGVIGVGFSCECGGESIVTVYDCCELVERVVGVGVGDGGDESFLSDVGVIQNIHTIM